MLMSWISRWVSRILVLLGVTVSLQVPMFISQYEANLQVRHQELAQVLSMTQEHPLGESVPKTKGDEEETAEDEDSFSISQIIQRQIVEVEALKEKIEADSWWKKPFNFVSNYNSKVADETLSQYICGIPFKLDAIPFALIGALIGYSVYTTIAWSLHRFLTFLKQGLSSKNSKISDENS